MEYYVNFRHTSNLENFNSMMLNYAPKRIGFGYDSFCGRILLAALDHNFHLFRQKLGGQFKRVYSKRSGNWRAEPVKERKVYKYIDVLQADILRCRADDEESITRHVEISSSNPVRLAPNIAMRPAPPTIDIVAAKRSRFEKK